jgi:hypothetical protein
VISKPEVFLCQYIYIRWLFGHCLSGYAATFPLQLHRLFFHDAKFSPCSLYIYCN